MLFIGRLAEVGRAHDGVDLVGQLGANALHRADQFALAIPDLVMRLLFLHLQIQQIVGVGVDPREVVGVTLRRNEIVAILGETLGSISTPVFGIWGEKDPLVPPINANLLLQKLPKSRAIYLDASHFVWEPQPEAYATAVWLGQGRIVEQSLIDEVAVQRHLAEGARLVVRAADADHPDAVALDEVARDERCDLVDARSGVGRDNLLYEQCGSAGGHECHYFDLHAGADAKE